MSDPDLEVGLVRFYGRVARTVEGKVRSARRLPDTSLMTLLTKGADGSRLSKEKDIRLLRMAEIETLEDILSTGIYRLAAILGVEPRTIRKWGLHTQAEDMLERLNPEALERLATRKADVGEPPLGGASNSRCWKGGDDD